MNAVATIDMMAAMGNQTPLLLHNTYHIVGMKCFESFSCWLQLSGNAAMPATMPAAIKISEMMDQMTPQHWLEPP